MHLLNVIFDRASAMSWLEKRRQKLLWRVDPSVTHDELALVEDFFGFTHIGG